MKNKSHRSFISISILTFSFVLLVFSISTLAASSENTPNRPHPVADFDGDGKTDISVFRPSDGYWHIMKSSGGFSSVQFGREYDRPVPGDFDGDGKTDLAVDRPAGLMGDGNDIWYVSRSSDGSVFSKIFGVSGGFTFDAPRPADYDGDGKTDIASWTLQDYNAPAYFKIVQSSSNSSLARQWGLSFDYIVPADYDGDGKADLAVYRYAFTGSKSEGIWYILQSSNGSIRVERFGLPDDRYVPADYDGDGKADLAVWRPSNGTWYFLNSSNGSLNSAQFGISTDKPTPGDYDGDGKTDIAVWRPSNGTWYLLRSTQGFAAQQFGVSSDVPVPNVFVRNIF